MDTANTKNYLSQKSGIERYYRFHSHIYDATRWSFLFGRGKIMSLIPNLPPQPRILEIGCGTGKNLKQLAYKFPDAQLKGVDLSAEMLNLAEQKLKNSVKIQLRKARYGTDSFQTKPCDLILLSYSLSMFGDNTEHILEHIVNDLKRGGYIAVVDFNMSSFTWFKRWMAINHVDLSGSLLPMLKKYFSTKTLQTRNAYMGLWSYFLFIGQHN